MKFHASDVKVMFIIITCIRTIIYIYIYISGGFAQQYRKCGARSGSPQLFIIRARDVSQIYALNNYAFLVVNGMPILHLW